MSFATLIGLGSESPSKSVMMIGLGLLLAAVGFDTITGAPRLTFGRIEILSGIGFVPVTIGLFGMGEILASAEEQGIGFVERLSAKVGLKDIVETLGELRKRIWTVVITAVIGFWFGVLPGHGATAGLSSVTGSRASTPRTRRTSGRARSPGSWRRRPPLTHRPSDRSCRWSRSASRVTDVGRDHGRPLHLGTAAGPAAVHRPPGLRLGTDGEHLPRAPHHLHDVPARRTAPREDHARALRRHHTVHRDHLDHRLVLAEQQHVRRLHHASRSGSWVTGSAR
jgi:hypothetical protein